MAVPTPTTPIELLLMQRLEAAEIKLNNADTWAQSARASIDELSQKAQLWEAKFNKLDSDMVGFANQVETAVRGVAVET